MPDAPENLRFSSDHLWVVRVSDALLRVGITDYAQQNLGDVIAVTLPEVGSSVTAGEPCGDIESTKSVSDLIPPVTGTIDKRNDTLADSPDLLNSDPYQKGWIFEVRCDPSTVAAQLGRLMDAGAYHHLTGE
jgi:glycine cleavage system H protein